MPDENGQTKYNETVDIFAMGIIYLALVNHQPGEYLKPIKGKVKSTVYIDIGAKIARYYTVFLNIFSVSQLIIFVL